MPSKGLSGKKGFIHLLIIIMLNITLDWGPLLWLAFLVLFILSSSPQVEASAALPRPTDVVLGLWLTTEELLALPTSGTAYNNVLKIVRALSAIWRLSL